MHIWLTQVPCAPPATLPGWVRPSVKFQKGLGALGWNRFSRGPWFSSYECQRKILRVPTPNGIVSDCHNTRETRVKNRANDHLQGWVVDQRARPSHSKHMWLCDSPVLPLHFHACGLSRQRPVCFQKAELCLPHVWTPHCTWHSAWYLEAVW